MVKVAARLCSAHTEIREAGERSAMQTLIEFIIGLVAAIAAAALAQFGVDVNAPRTAEREIRRISDCPEPPTAAVTVQTPSRNC
jgi:hypothetical protein